MTRFTSGHEDSGVDHDFDLFDEGVASNAGLVGVLGEYLLLEPIGTGGMGQVFRAEHRTMNREVALKVLSKNIAERGDLLEQFFAEIRAVAKLMHTNIVTAFDAGSVGDTHYLVMELVDGEILSSRVRQNGPMATEEAVSILEQAAKALAYAHSVGIVHRDIKPSNMMLTPDGVLKILDFGLARFGSAKASDSNQNLFIGTPEYMSPEQIESPDEVDGRSDLYSLGATLYYLLTGRAMFSGEQMQVARAQLHQKPTPLFVARSDVDLRLDAVFQRLVEKRAKDRYSSAQELLTSLEELNLTAQPAVGEALPKGAYRLASESSTSVAYDKSTLAKKSQIVAIDLGLLTSTSAYYDTELGPQIISQGEGNAQFMRNMLWSSGDQIKIGAEAVALRQVDPENVLHSVQRWIGASHIRLPFAGKKVPPQVILAAVLRQLMHNSSALTDNSSSAVVTVPSCYDQTHRRAIRTACRIAGIELVQLLDKPLAAALSWLDVNSRLSVPQTGQGTLADAKLLIVHLGGSGLDASVVQVQGATATQLASCGHWKFGTQRWQHLLGEYFSAALKEKTGQSIREDVSAATRLQRTLELAMDRLTRSSKVEVRFDWLNTSIQQTITQEGFAKIAQELVRALQQSITSACATARTDPSEIDYVLLAGPMMHMKPLQKIVKALIPHEVKLTMMERAEFARGAAIQAHNVSALSSRDGLVPNAVGCTAYDIAFITESQERGSQKPRVLLEKATPVPASLSRTIRPSAVGGGHVFPTLQLIESSSLGESSWVRLGKVQPEQVFAERPKDDPLQLRFEVDENGILESSLLWPGGNRQTRLPASLEPELSAAEVVSWREWLEMTMLCSDS